MLAKFRPFAVLLCCWFVLGFAVLKAETGQLKGRIIDENQQPLPGVNINLEGTVLGAATNLDGFFIIRNIPASSYTVSISSIGYQTVKMPVRIESNLTLDLETIELIPKPISGETVVITASKYEQQLADIPSSVNLITRQDLQIRNIITIDEALKYVPGITMNASQINIRGSSGYSRGVGTRVMFLLDGIPILTGDTREISYDVVPTHQIERVEIVKGAGSALYGSSALGGVVNIITKDIGQSPSYYFKLYGGLHSKSIYDSWNWSRSHQPYSGASGHLSRFYNNVGIQLGGAYDYDGGYRQNTRRNRYTGSGKFQWSPSSQHQLTLTGTYMNQERENFLYWDGVNRALQPPTNQLGDEVNSTRYYLTGNYRYILENNQLLNVRGIWFHNRFKDNIASTDSPGNQSTSNNLNAEIQYVTQFDSYSIVTGLEGTNNQIKDSNIFGIHSGTNFAGYLQIEGKVIGNFGITAGMRLDYFEMDSVDSESQMNPKLGLTYSPVKNTTLRSSLARGFRAPSLAEVFTSTVTGGFEIISNTELRPEKSTYFEVGINHLFHQRVILDLAYFHTRLEDLIEADFLPTGQVQFQNITAATINGIETTVSSQLIPKYLHISASYTYVDPKDDKTGQYLQFRPRNLFYLNTRTSFSNLELFLDYRFVQKYDQIDENFAAIITDGNRIVDAHVVDIRVIYPFWAGRIPFRLSFQISNALRYYYNDLLGSLAPLRGLTLTLESGF
jgi:iron complex outermembrane receptor protein